MHVTMSINRKPDVSSLLDWNGGSFVQKRRELGLHLRELMMGKEYHQMYVIGLRLLAKKYKDSGMEDARAGLVGFVMDSLKNAPGYDKQFSHLAQLAGISGKGTSSDRMSVFFKFVLGADVRIPAG